MPTHKRKQNNPEKEMLVTLVQQPIVLTIPLHKNYHSFFRANVKNNHSRESLLFFHELLQQMPTIAKNILTAPLALPIYLSYLLPAIAAKMQSVVISDPKTGQIIGLNATEGFIYELSKDGVGFNHQWLNCSINLIKKALEFYWTDQSPFNCSTTFDHGMIYFNQSSDIQSSLRSCIENFVNDECQSLLSFSSMIMLLFVSVAALVFIAISCWACQSNGIPIITTPLKQLQNLLIGTINKLCMRGQSEEQLSIAEKLPEYGTATATPASRTVVTINADEAQMQDRVSNSMYPV